MLYKVSQISVHPGSKEATARLGYSLILESETLLLKTPHNFDTGLGGIKTKLTCKPPPYRLSLVVSVGSVKAAKREEQLVVLLRC